MRAEKEIWAPDLEWECTWEKNSKEAMALENVVRKIRSRCGECKGESKEDACGRLCAFLARFCHVPADLITCSTKYILLNAD